jgi:nucleotide-binding universal stress UspA family protein
VSASAASKRSEPSTDLGTAERVLLASEGRRFTPEVIEVAARLARPVGGKVRVLTIARLWGTGLGLPHPGLRPNRRELAVHEDNVANAIRELNAAGVAANGHIITTRKPWRSILNEAGRLGSHAVVMGADPRRPWFVGDFMWSQEPYRVRRHARIPTHLVGPDGPG